MKTFLVFLAVMLLNISFLCFHSDMAHYQKLQVFLKAAAEECAGGGALYQDEEAFSQGKLVIKEEEAKKFAKALAEDTGNKLSGRAKGKLDITLQIFDDEKGYRGCEAYGLRDGTPSVYAELRLSCRDLFRLPFFTLTAVKRGAVYQWENRYGAAEGR